MNSLVQKKGSSLNRLLSILLLIVFIMYYGIEVKAQVTIGSGNPPNGGVLLDLKEQDDEVSLAGGRTATKGIILPRVALVSSTSLDGISGADIVTPKRYAGLSVYNITNNTSVSEGINVWDGSKWVNMQTPALKKSAVKGTGESLSTSAISGLANWRKIQFNTEEFDVNNEYDNQTLYEFTALKDGIYSVYAQYKISGVLNASEAGIGILKKSPLDPTYTVVAQEIYLNVSVALVGVLNPPTRSISTLLNLKAGDKIIIGVYSTINIALLGGQNSFFTVHQIN